MHITAISHRLPPCGQLVARLLRGSWRVAPGRSSLTEAELHRIVSALIGSRTGPLGWRKLSASQLGTSEPADKLRQAYRYSCLMAAVREHQVKGVVNLLRSEGIEPVLVKGWAAARLYPEQALRPSGDIDLCVPPRQFEAARSILHGPEGKQYFVDLHVGFNTLDTRSFEELFERTDVAYAGDTAIRVLGLEDHLRVLCLHFLRHGAWLPIWLCDIAVAVEARPPSFEWNLCLGADRLRADWVACTIGLAHRLLGAEVDGTPVAQRARHLPKWFVSRVLKSWDTPQIARHALGPTMSTYLSKRDLLGSMKALFRRWPDAVYATYTTEAPINNTPRLPYQLVECWRRFSLFVPYVPAALKGE
jgi:hypothetical protein